MQLTTPHNLNTVNSPAFKGLNAGAILNSGKIEKISNCRMDGLLQKLKDKAGTEVIQKIGDEAKLIRPKNGIITQLKELPLDIGLYITRKFHVSSDFFNNYAQAKTKKASQMAANGFYEYGERFVNKAINEIKDVGEKLKLDNCINNVCDGGTDKICESVQKDFISLLNKDLRPDNSAYNTRDERTLVKFFTGLVSALWLFLDFHNNSVRDGKIGKDTNKEAGEKFIQEMKETSGEAGIQWLTLGCLSRWINNSPMAAAFLNFATSTVLRVTSRLSSHKPLTPIKEKIQSIFKPVSFNEFQEAAKKGEQINTSPIAQKPKEKEKKKHILTFKNIAIWFGASVLGGYALKYATPKAKELAKEIFNKIKSKPKAQDLISKVKKSSFYSTVEELPKKFRNATVGERKITVEQFDDLLVSLTETGNKELARYARSSFCEQIEKNGVAFVGEYEKMTHIPFTKIPLSKKDLYSAPLIPLKIVKGVLTYPYELVSNAVNGLRGIKAAGKGAKLKDPNELVNLVNDFLLQREKFKGKSDKEFIEFYGKHLEKHWTNALNCVTRSNVNNTDIGKLTQIFGTGVSIYFACTDDFNRTMRATNDKELAVHDARKRGVNKLFKTVAQLPIISTVNRILKIPYGTSLFGATAISMGVTFVTEAVAHFLAGMPLKKLDTQEEYKEYQDKHKNGAMRWYYKLIDKITA